jgi:CheY-like chemotaxis protein
MSAPERLGERRRVGKCHNRSQVQSVGVSKLVILLVEDEELQRSQIATMLQLLGHEVEAVGSSEEAMLVLGRRVIDVLIADVGLPGMSGDVFAAEARAVQPSIRVVFATGRASMAEPRDPGGPVLLRKPFGLQELEDALRTG